jgi:23S rRNA (pseudouridine1915-N3)-methyltransferase
VKLLLLTLGKTDSPHLRILIEDFSRRLNRYLPFELVEIPDLKKKSKGDPGLVREGEAREILKRIQPGDAIWLLDERGKEYSSREFAARLQKGMNSGPKRLVLIIGGAYGHGPSLKQRADTSISLSKMTFNHQVVRLMAVEQLYRAFTILKGEPYHND